MNSDYNKRVSIDTLNFLWEKTENLNVFKKVLSIKDNQEIELTI